MTLGESPKAKNERGQTAQPHQKIKWQVKGARLLAGRWFDVLRQAGASGQRPEEADGRLGTVNGRGKPSEASPQMKKDGTRSCRSPSWAHGAKAGCPGQ